MAEETRKTKTRTQTVEEVTVEVQEILDFDSDSDGTLEKTPIEKFNELAQKVNILEWRAVDLIPSSHENSDIQLGKGIWVRYETSSTRILKAKETEN